jgi:hypothetical protein
MKKRRRGGGAERSTTREKKYWLASLFVRQAEERSQREVRKNEDDKRKEWF